MSARQWWRERAPRERRAVLVGAYVLLAAGAYAGLWRPLSTELGRLTAELPQLRAQAASVRQDAALVERLQSQRGASAAAAEDPARLLARSAAAHRLEGIGIVIEPASGRLKATFERVAFDAWLGWIDELHRVHRVSVAASRIEALAAPGLVRVEVELMSAAHRR